MNTVHPAASTVRTWSGFIGLTLLISCALQDETDPGADPTEGPPLSTESTTETGAVVPSPSTETTAPTTPTTSTDPSHTHTTPTSDTGTPPTDTTLTEEECVFDTCGGEIDGLWVGSYECGRGVVDYDYGTSKSSTVAPYGDYFGLEKVCSGVTLDRHVDIELWYLFEDDTLFTSFTYDVDTQAHYPLGCGDDSCDDIVRWYTEFYQAICEQPQNEPCGYASFCEPKVDGCACTFDLEYTWNSGVQPYTVDGTTIEIEGILYEYCVEGDQARFGDPKTLEGLYLIERP